MPVIFWLVPVSSVLALSFAYFFFRQMMGYSEGTDMMKKIAQHVRKGASGHIYASSTR
jgi:K(+)-stimulated pyrophosphate-energized sodium pump